MKRVRSIAEEVERKESPPFNTTHSEILDDQTMHEINSIRDQVNFAIGTMSSLLGNTIDSMQRLLDCLDAKISVIHEKQTHYEELHTLMRKNSERAQRVIKLNLRGRTFETVKDNLLRIEGTYFHAMLSSGVWTPLEDGAYFIDRPPEAFERILEFLSSGRMSYAGLNEYEVECLEANLDYFLLRQSVAPVNFTSSNDLVRLHCDIWSLMQLRDGRVCSGSAGRRIKLWNLSTGACEKTLEGHTAWAVSLTQLNDGRLCSGSYDGDNTIKIWNIVSGDCEHTLTGHGGAVWAVAQMRDGRLCSGSADKTIKVWSLTTMQCESTLEGHAEGIYSLIQLADSRLCSASEDGTLKLWNVTSGLVELSIEGHSSSINSVIQLFDSRLCSGSSDRSIKIWTLATGNMELTLLGHTDGIWALTQLQDRRICSGSWDKTIRIWNLFSGSCDQILEGHTGHVRNVLQLEDGRLCSASKDTRIKIWS